MKKILKLISVICIIALFAGCSLVSKVEDDDKKSSATVVTVDGKNISEEMFNIFLYNAQGNVYMNSGFQSVADIPEDFWEGKGEGAVSFDEVKQNALDSIIETAVVCAKAEELGLELTEEDKTNAENTLTQMKNDENTSSIFKGLGVSFDTVEEYYNQILLSQKVLPELIKKGEIKVDSKAALDTFKKDYVKAKHILISTVDSATGAALSEDEVKAAKDKAQDILNQLNAGAVFDTLMKEHNEDPGMSSQPDGYVFTTGEMVEEFEKAAFALKENEISGLVETSYGVHIIKRVPFDMSADTEKAYIENIESQSAVPQFEELIDKWVKESKVRSKDKIIEKKKPFGAELFYGA